MLNDGEFGKHFRLIHFDQSLVDFGPFRDAANVPKLIRVFVKWTRLHFGDVLDAAEKHEVLGERFVIVLFDEVAGLKPRVADQLPAAPNKRDELIIVEAPDAVTAGRFHPVGSLKLPAKFDVRVEYLQDGGGSVGFFQNLQFEQAAEEGDEAKFMPRAIIDASRVTERFSQIGLQLDDRRMRVSGQGLP